MKKSLAICLASLSFGAFASGPQFDNITKEDVKNVTKEFGTNFSHTVVGAPETNGMWGVEVGVLGGQTSSKKFSDIVERSGGDGKDFKNIYHAGVFARAHFPFEIFAEASFLPEQEISDVKIKSNSFGIGWNAGNFFYLPLDLTIAADYSNGEVSFSQTQPVNTKINLKTTTTNYWVGVSRRFVFVTPYVKVGTSTVDGSLKADASIFTFSSSQKEKANVTGSFVAYGANFEFLGIRLGVEGTSMHNTQRISGKLSYSF